MPVFETNEYPFTDLRPLLSHSPITLQSPDIPDADSVAAAFALYLFFTANHKPTAWFHAGETAIDTPCLLEMVDVFDLPIRHIPFPAPCPGLLIRGGMHRRNASGGGQGRGVVRLSRISRQLAGNK